MKLTKEIEYFFNRYELHVGGDADNGTRFCIISVPTSAGIETCRLTDSEFDTFWQSFLTDKDAVKLLFEKSGVDADLTDVPNDIINGEPQ